MDFYEAGANSDWLLPNRLYRSVYYGTIPIALAAVENGRWLQNYEAGLRLEHVSADSIAAKLSQFSAADYQQAKAKLEAIPTSGLVAGRADCIDLVRRLTAPEAEPFAACTDIHKLDRLPPSATAGV